MPRPRPATPGEQLHTETIAGDAPASLPAVVFLRLDTTRAGGIERFAADLAAAARDHIDWRMQWCGRWQHEGLVGFLRAALQLRRTCRHQPVAAIAVERLQLLPIAVAATASMGRGRRPRLVCFAYGSEIVSPSRRLWKRLLVRRVGKVVAISTWTAAAVREVLSYRGPVQVLHPGLWRELWNCSAQQRPPSGEPLVVSVARLDTNARHKGIDRVVDAIAMLVARSPDRPLHYTIVGSGDDESRIDSLVSASGLGGRVDRRSGLTDRELRELLDRAAAFALPSWPAADQVEGFGIALLEAAARGVPVIATAAAGSADAVADGVTGIVVDGSPASIADAIERILAGELAGAAARRRAWLEPFWWEGRGAEVGAAVVSHDVTAS